MNEAVIYMNRVDSEEARELLRQNAENDLSNTDIAICPRGIPKARAPPDRVFEQYKDVLSQASPPRRLATRPKNEKASGHPVRYGYP